jgi:hypothetical protein
MDGGNQAISSICSISDATTTAENRLALVILKGGPPRPPFPLERPLQTVAIQHPWV